MRSHLPIYPPFLVLAKVLARRRSVKVSGESFPRNKGVDDRVEKFPRSGLDAESVAIEN
jgi:hypothetical protein